MIFSLPRGDFWFHVNLPAALIHTCVKGNPRGLAMEMRRPLTMRQLRWRTFQMLPWHEALFGYELWLLFFLDRGRLGARSQWHVMKGYERFFLVNETRT